MSTSAIKSQYRRLRTGRRELLRKTLAAAVFGSVCSPLIAQAPPPPPPPPVRGSTTSSGFLPTSTEIMYRLRQNATFERDEAARLQGLIEDVLVDQRSLLLDYGIDAYYPPPNIRLSSRDAKNLTDAMDDVMDLAEEEANDFLTRAQMSAFRSMLRQEASARRSAINAMRR